VNAGQGTQATTRSVPARVEQAARLSKLSGAFGSPTLSVRTGEPPVPRETLSSLRSFPSPTPWHISTTRTLRDTCAATDLRVHREILDEKNSCR
jgi:hypothetical protein